MSVVRRGMLAILAAVSTAATPLCAQAPGAAEKLTARVQTAYEQAQREQYAASLATVRTVIGDKGFAALSDSTRAYAYLLAMNDALQQKDNAAAYDLAFKGTAVKGADAALWRVRLVVEVGDKRLAPAVATVEAMSAENRDALYALPIPVLGALNGAVRRQPDKALQQRLLVVLSAPDYQPEPFYAQGDGFRGDYAALLVETGRKDEAAALVGTIKDPNTLIWASLDPRLRGFLPGDYDGRAAFERRLARLRELAASHSRSMAGVLLLSIHLRKLGRYEEALATLEAARPDGPLGSTFTDLAEQSNWWWDERARNYQVLGRYDEAVAAFGKGIDAKESGGLNVSQTINLGVAQLRFGHHADAINTIAAFTKGTYSISPFGEMQLRSVRGCATMATGDTVTAKADLAYAVAHEQDAPDVLAELLLCAGDMDGAAAAYIRRLDNADRRSDALLQLSDYDPPPSTYPLLPYEARLPALKARPDVQAAIRRAGGTRRFRLQAGE